MALLADTQRADAKILARAKCHPDQLAAWEALSLPLARALPPGSQATIGALRDAVLALAVGDELTADQLAALTAPAVAALERVAGSGAGLRVVERAQ